MKKNSKYIFFLDRQQLIIAGINLNDPVTLNFPVNIVSDIDVIDLESFDLLLTNFFNQSKISPGDILLIVSPNVYYQKNITLSADTTERQNQIDLFLQTIPFKNLIYRDYLLDNQPQLLALNKNFYEPLVRFCQKNNFNITAIVPHFVLDHYQLNLTEYLPKEVKNILQKYKQIETYSLINSQDIEKIISAHVRRPKEDNTRAYILLGVFCLLFVILLGFMFIRPRLIKPPVTKTIPVKLSPTLVPAFSQITPTPTITYLSPDSVRIKVVNSSGVANQASKIKQLLTTGGFQQISTTSTSKVTAEKNQISYAPTISTETRQKIKILVESIAGISVETESSVLEDTDVLIVTTFKLVAQPTP